jgi:uncharacterized protein YwqG
MHAATTQRLKELGLDTLPQDVLADVREAVHFQLVRAKDSQIPVGNSKFGGEPDLPAGWDWPANQKTGCPLAFFGQISFAEAHPFDLERQLPGQGAFYFFINPDVTNFDNTDPQMWRVLFHNGNASVLARRATPAVLSRKSGDDTNVCISPCRVEFEREIQFGNDFEDYYNELLMACDDDSDEGKDAKAMLKAMDRWKVLRNGKPKKVCVDTSRPYKEPEHQLLGHTHFGGCDEPDGHRLLLKIDADHKRLGMEFLDAGMWFLFVPASNLKAGDFSKAKVRLHFA